jgi:hypothetical protein
MNPDMILKGMLIDDNVSSKNILKIKSKKDNNKHLILIRLYRTLIVNLLKLDLIIAMALQTKQIIKGIINMCYKTHKCSLKMSLYFLTKKKTSKQGIVNLIF